MPAPKVTSLVEDKSTRVQSTSTYNTAIVIEAKKGPIDVPVKVTGQTDFLKRYTPNERYELGWDLGILEAYRYLDEESGLYVVRCANISDIKTGGCIFSLNVDGNDNTTFKTSSAYPTGLNYTQFKSLELNGSWIAGEKDACILFATSPGKYSDDIAVEIIIDEKRVKLPGAFIVNVYNNSLLKETYTCSLNPSLKSGYGVNCSIDKVLANSSYIRGFANPISDYLLETTYEVSINSNRIGYVKNEGLKDDTISIDEVYETPYCLTKYTKISGQEYECKYTGNSDTHYMLPKPGLVKFTAGDDGSIASSGDRIRALKTLGNMNEVNIQLVLDGGIATEEYHNAINDLCIKRNRSCHGIISTAYEDEVNSEALSALTNYRKYRLNMNSYSMEMYTPHQKYYDEFNDRYVWLSPGPYVATLIMRTARERGWHWAVAGYNRGVVSSIDVANPFDMEIIDELSDMQINTIRKDPGSGNIIWDEQTLWNQAADLQDAHISRWVNIYLRPALEEMLKSFLFEFNDEETRNLIIKKIETFMDPQKAARACYAYRVICDETNNLPDDIENNRLNCWLYVKATKIAKWIKQSIILSPYSANLEALEI